MLTACRKNIRSVHTYEFEFFDVFSTLLPVKKSFSVLFSYLVAVFDDDEPVHDFHYRDLTSYSPLKNSEFPEVRLWLRGLGQPRSKNRQSRQTKLLLRYFRRCRPMHCCRRRYYRQKCPLRPQRPLLLRRLLRWTDGFWNCTVVKIKKSWNSKIDIR